MELERADIEAIAERVVELLESRPLPVRSRLLDAAELARLLAVERDWVYAHATELGAIRLGGPQGRLRFDLRRVEAALGDASRPVARDASAERARRPRRHRTDGLELLPYES